MRSAELSGVGEGRFHQFLRQVSPLTYAVIVTRLRGPRPPLWWPMLFAPLRVSPSATNC